MITTICAEKGGVGKSRVATHVAALAKTAGVDVVLLDTDNQGSASSWSRIRNENEVSPAVPVFTLPRDPLNELANLAPKYQLIVVDIGAQNYKTMQEVALVSDLVLVPCGNDQQEVESTLNLFATFKALGPRHETGAIPAHVLLTRVSPLEASRSVADLREVFIAHGISVFDSALPMRAAWQITGKTGRALHELKGKERSDKAAQEMDAVYAEILEKFSVKGGN